MQFSQWYQAHFEDRIKGRYLPLQSILPLLKEYAQEFEISVIGSSENGVEIPCIEIGTGKKVILAWSQMHGNESTTTKSIFDFLKLISQKDHFQDEISHFLKKHRLVIIPILNPDGAALYTRENANEVDLNRDAKNLSQSESRALRELFDHIEPDLCLNMHDQRTIYGLSNGRPATLSFLSPAADAKCSITPARRTAMDLIEGIAGYLQQIIPGQVGRYDDSFNENCVGDTFQMQEVPTILFEAGHYHGDYHRETTREYIFYALCKLTGLIQGKPTPENTTDYLSIPENQQNFRDVILRNVHVKGVEGLTSVALQFEELLIDGAIHWQAQVDSIGDLDHLFGHEEIDGKSANILMNSYENVFVGAKVIEIFADNATKQVFFRDSSINI